MLKIGLTGGIGCGKTTIANLFAAKGVPVIDADEVARAFVELGQPALEAIAAHFGEDVLVKGRLIRARLRERVFADTAERQWLEALLHPMVYGAMQQQVDALTAPYCLLVVPLLLETGRRRFVDRLLVVDCNLELQRQRVKCRDGLDDEVFNLIVGTQMSRAARLLVADDVIENYGEVERLRWRVDELHMRYLELASWQEFCRHPIP